MHLYMMHIEILEKQQHFYACSTVCFGFLTESRKEKKDFYGCSHFMANS